MRFLDTGLRHHVLRYLWQSMAAGLVIFVVLMLLDAVQQTAIIASLGASAFIVFAAPRSYAAQPRARAIIHVHPVFLLALEQAGADILELDLYEAAQIRKEFVQAPPLPPGSDDLAQAVAEASIHARAVHMAKHGLTCWGESLEHALNLAEEVEALAKIQFQAGLKSWRRQ